MAMEGVAAGITCIDLSPVAAVQRMRDRLAAQGTHGVEVVLADMMLDLPLESESFDLVIEKGIMDVLFVDSGDPWNPNPTMVDNVMEMLQDVHRALKPQTVYLYQSPLDRLRRFATVCIYLPSTLPASIFRSSWAAGFTWSVEYNTFGDGFHCFFYTLKKRKRSLESNSCQNALLVSPKINMFHEELENKDYIFRTNVEEL